MICVIYFQPQFRTNSGEILNVVSNTGQLLGYLLYMYKENDDLYVLGQLDEVGEKQNYIDLIKKFISGLKDSTGVKKDPFVRVTCGGEEIKLDQKEEEKES
jgi:hypothetical protein